MEIEQAILFFFFFLKKKKNKPFPAKGTHLYVVGPCSESGEVISAEDVGSGLGISLRIEETGGGVVTDAGRGHDKGQHFSG